MFYGYSHTKFILKKLEKERVNEREGEKEERERLFNDSLNPVSPSVP